MAGFIYGAEGAEAAYLVHWTVGAVAKHGAKFDLIIGKWGEAAAASDRVAVSLTLQYGDRGPYFTVIDASERPIGTSDLVGSALAREAVVGTPLSRTLFELVDEIWLHDDRIIELTRPAA